MGEKAGRASKTIQNVAPSLARALEPPLNNVTKHILVSFTL